MTFRANFIIDAITSTAWVLMNLAFYTLIFRYTPCDRRRHGLGASTSSFSSSPRRLLINSIVQALFMTNADELSELVRTGTLDFALLKPIDTQFLVSLTRIDWSSLGNLIVGRRADGLFVVRNSTMCRAWSRSCSIRSTSVAAWRSTTA